MKNKSNLPSNPAGDVKRLVGGLGWNLVAVIGEQISTLVAFVLIARILGPSDFGTVILSVALIDILTTFVRSGTSEALIRSKDMNETILGTGFWLNMIFAVILSIGVYGFAPIFGWIFTLPESVPLLQTMTIVFPIVAAGSVAESLLAKRMAFAAIARRQILGSLAGATTAVALLYSGYGVWAMIFQRIVIAIVGAGLAIYAARLVPPLKFSIGAAKEIGRFSGGITTTNLLYRLQPRATELVIGLLAQPIAVALFRAAYRIVDLVNQLPMQPVMRVIFPTLSRLTNEPERFRAVLKKFMEGFQTILLPLYVGVGYFATDIFHILFGSKWDGAVPAFVILLGAAGLRITFTLLGPAAAAKGAVKRSASFALMDVSLSLLVMTIVAPWGIEAIAGSRVAVAFMLWPIAYYTLMKPMGLTFSDVVHSLKNPVLIAVLLLACLAGANHFYSYFNIPQYFIVNLIVSALLYAALIVVISWRGLAELLTVCGINHSKFTSRVITNVRPK